MNSYPNELNQIIIKQFTTFFKNRFVESLKHVDQKFDDENCISARINLDGKNIKGILAVNANRNTLLQCHPERRYGDEITEEDLTDWIGEIVNRGLGNMKNELLKYNIETTLNPPMHTTDAFDGDPRINSPVARFVFSNGKEVVCVLFQAEISDLVEFEKTA